MLMASSFAPIAIGGEEALYSTISDSLITMRISEKQGLCLDGLLLWTPIIIGGDEAARAVC